MYSCVDWAARMRRQTATRHDKRRTNWSRDKKALAACVVFGFGCHNLSSDKKQNQACHMRPPVLSPHPWSRSRPTPAKTCSQFSKALVSMGLSCRGPYHLPHLDAASKKVIPFLLSCVWFTVMGLSRSLSRFLTNTCHFWFSGYSITTKIASRRIQQHEEYATTPIRLYITTTILATLARRINIQANMHEQDRSTWRRGPFFFLSSSRRP